MLETQSGHILACPAVRMGRFRPGFLPDGWYEQFRENQQLPSCCRSPENHMISAYYSSKEDRDRGVPDIYKIVCTETHDLGGNHPPEKRFGPAVHPRFMLGSGTRPFWDAR